MKTLEKFLKEDKKTPGVMAFGRFNPPTTGHHQLIKKVESTAKQHNGTPHIIASHSEGSAKNPLPQKKKIGYLKKLTQHSSSVHGSSKQEPTILHHAARLNKHHDHLVVVAGSDRQKEYHDLLHKYNNKALRHGHYNYKSIKVVSSGHRDPDSEGTTGISGTKMRDHARSGNHVEFKKGLPKELHPHAKEMINHIKSVKEEMNMEEYLDEKKKAKKLELDDITDKELDKFVDQEKDTLKEYDEDDQEESVEEEAPLGFTQRLRRARVMKRLAPRLARQRKIRKFKLADPKRLEKRSRKMAIKFLRKKIAGKRGENYQSLSISDKMAVDRLLAKKMHIVPRIAKRLMPKIRKAEIERLKRARSQRNENHALFNMIEKMSAPQDKDIADRKGTQPAKYHKGLSPTTKAARDAQFKKQSKMADDNPAAYKPAPGDATAKTKPSKYTKMYKDMFGETNEEYELTEKSMEALKKKASKSGHSYGTLKKVYNRGVAAWKTGHRPGTTPQQWGYARVNAFIAKKKAGTLNHDKDLANEYIPEQAQQNYNTPAADHKADKIYPYQAAIKDLDLNTKNRNKTIKEYDYGPANPEAGDLTKMYWEKKADLWGCSVEMVKTMKCMNCAAFDQKPQTLKLMADAIGPDGDRVVKNGNLGFCELFEFKCAGNRTCDAWVGGGPLKESKAPVIGGVKMKKLGTGKKGSYKELVKRHLGAKAAEKVTKSDGVALAKIAKKSDNIGLMRKANFIKNMMKEETTMLNEGFIAGIPDAPLASRFMKIRGGFDHHPDTIKEYDLDEEGGAGEEGTKKLLKKLKKDTPGEDL